MSKFYDEKTLGLYMMFKVEEVEDEGMTIIAYREGNSKSAYMLKGIYLENYMQHLDFMIEGCEKRLKIFNNDSSLIKKMDKYKLYKKRLENAISKLEKVLTA